MDTKEEADNTDDGIKHIFISQKRGAAGGG
jgi:hypothetical protein